MLPMTPVEVIGLMFLIAIVVIAGSMFVTPKYWTKARIDAQTKE